MLDERCGFRRFKYDLALNDQPAIDLEIYGIIRNRYMQVLKGKPSHG